MSTSLRGEGEDGVDDLPWREPGRVEAVHREGRVRLRDLLRYLFGPPVPTGYRLVPGVESPLPFAR
ncbi:hypothetical protein, partial [Actinacidiphila rubida]|uniref:hypothetical protein n=1 Tax=Actinacidiphila rubida TaxID=310780 RepID=UPI001C4087F8